MIFAYIGAAVFGLLGVGHLAYTLSDLFSVPRYFSPTDPTVLDAMKHTHARIAPRGQTYWKTLLGFHLSHAMGVLMFALLIFITAHERVGWMMPITSGIGLTFIVIAWRCWFPPPLVGITIGTLLISAVWIIG